MNQHLSQYKIFYEVANAGTISKFAKELYISLPAISKSIIKLEDSLGVALFIRSSKGVQLTAEGKVLFEHVKAAFDALDRGELELKRIQEFHIGHIRIGVSNTLCKYILLPYLKAFIGEYPHIKITIESQSTSHTLAMLEQQQIDIGLIARPQLIKGLHFLPIIEIEDIFVATPSYLSNLRLREGEYADRFQAGNLVLLDQNNITRHHIDEYMIQNQITANSLLEVTTMDLLIEFSKIGLGIGCVIKEFVKNELNSGTLVQLPLSPPIHKRTVGFAYNLSRSSKALDTFLAFFQTERKKSVQTANPLFLINTKTAFRS